MRRVNHIVSPLCLAALVACEPVSLPMPRTASPRTTIPAPAEATETPPQARGVRVQNVAFGRSRTLVRIAISDLKRLGFWKELTGHLYVLKISSRTGIDNVPEDGHLADAFLTGQIDSRGAGALCDIMFFPTAMANDLARYDEYYRQGLLPDPTPTEREFWVSILAHELSHCLDHGQGEPAAEAWEKKVLTAARGRLD